MMETATQQSWVEKCVANNPYFADQSWLQPFRAEALRKFQQRGFPTRKEEAWKYTTMTSLSAPEITLPAKQSAASLLKLRHVLETKYISQHRMVFVNGQYAQELSHTSDLPKGVTLLPLSEAVVQQEEVVKANLLREYNEAHYPFATLNAALMSDGIFLQVPKGIVIAEPIHLIFLNTEQSDFTLQPRNIILVEQGAEVKLVEEHTAVQAQQYFSNVVTEIHAAENSHVHFYKLQNESLSATHCASIFIRQAQDSHVRTFTFSHGSKLAREDVTVLQAGPGAHTDMHGLYLLQQDQQHIDHHVHVDHQAPHGVSKMVYKGILAKKSRAVFNGKVYVHANAQHIHAHQANHNLLLSNDAEVNTKPELEIYANDVRCTHGATVGQLATDALFYLCSRGITKEVALKMLTQAFANEIFSEMDSVELREYVKHQVMPA